MQPSLYQGLLSLKWGEAGERGDGSVGGACILHCGVGPEDLPSELTPLGQRREVGEVASSAAMGRRGQSITKFQEGSLQEPLGTRICLSLLCLPLRLPFSHLHLS